MGIDPVTHEPLHKDEEEEPKPEPKPPLELALPPAGDIINGSASSEEDPQTTTTTTTTTSTCSPNENYYSSSSTDESSAALLDDGGINNIILDDVITDVDYDPLINYLLADELTPAPVNFTDIWQFPTDDQAGQNFDSNNNNNNNVVRNSTTPFCWGDDTTMMTSSCSSSWLLQDCQDFGVHDFGFDCFDDDVEISNVMNALEMDNKVQ